MTLLRTETILKVALVRHSSVVWITVYNQSLMIPVLLMRKSLVG